MPEKELERRPISIRAEKQAGPDPEVESREGELTRAIRGLLDALDRCAGDPPDCPHCGPARAFALDLVGPDEHTTTPSELESEQERVLLSGRVGADPTFRTTPKGTLVGRFSLAVHGEDKSTTWFPILTFNQRAEQIRDFVERGVVVNVVGYVHTRETRSRDGTPRTVREIYAVSVTSPRAK